MNIQEEGDCISMIDKYLSKTIETTNIINSNIEKDFSPISLEEKKNKKKKIDLKVVIHKKNHKEQILNDVSNRIEMKSSYSPKNIKYNSPLKQENVHSLVSPSKEILNKKKRRELKKQILLLTERINCMEDIQIENTKTIDELNQKLKETQKELREITKEKELVVQENNDLKLKLKELEKELDRHITNRWKSFVGEQVYTSHLPPSYN